jgi:hypothetical protein
MGQSTSCHRPDIPFGGIKQSGIGAECSVHGLKEFNRCPGAERQAKFENISASIVVNHSPNADGLPGGGNPPAARSDSLKRP